MSYFRENIERLCGYVPGFQPAGADVVKLNTNENPYPPSPHVLEAIRAVTGERLRRYPQPLGDEFRQAAAEVLAVEPDFIMCTNGGDELLSICLRAFCDGKRAVAYPVPTYTLYPVLAAVENCPVVEVPFDENFAQALAAAEGALTILCNPNAPTGGFVPVEKIAALAEKLKSVLLIDEAYVDFAEDNAVRLVKKIDNVIILRSLSKGYSLAGLRFGFCIAQPKIIEGLIKVKDSYNVDAIAVAAATAAIKDQRYFRENVEKIKIERSRLIKELRGLGISVGNSSTNFVLAGGDGFDARMVYKELADRNIYVRYFDREGLSDKLRITVGTKEQDDRLLEAIRKIQGG